MNATTTNLPNPQAQAESLQRALAEPFAFALLHWPLLLALLAAGDGGWWLALRLGCGVLLALALLAAYTRGVGFGNAMLAAAGFVVAAWWAWPTAWSLAWIGAIALLMLAAQNLRLRKLVCNAEAPTLADRLAAFDPAVHGGEVMATPLTGREQL